MFNFSVAYTDWLYLGVACHECALVCLVLSLTFDPVSMTLYLHILALGSGPNVMVEFSWCTASPNKLLNLDLLFGVGECKNYLYCEKFEFEYKLIKNEFMSEF